MKPILIINKPHPVFFDLLETAGFPYEEDYTSDYEALLEKIGAYSGLVLRSRVSLDRNFIAAASGLKFIAREGVGLDHIDLKACEEYQIPVIISPEGSRDTVGEHAIGMLLNLMNHLNRCNTQVSKGQWLREENRATELKGKTVGLIGYGNMGQSFARKVSGFEVEVLAYDKYRKDYGDEFAKAVDLSTLQKNADIISIHIPLDEFNKYFIDRAFFKALSKSVFLINTARGLVLETAALVEAMKDGQVKAAALDVLEYEDSSFDKLLDLEKLKAENADYRYLVESDQVLLSPHIAGWSFESKKKHAEVLYVKISQLLDC